jgi:hypothetical protein
MAKYDVDDILAEIKRKKAEQQGAAFAPSAPTAPAPARQPAAGGSGGRDIDSLLGSIREETPTASPAPPVRPVRPVAPPSPSRATTPLRLIWGKRRRSPALAAFRRRNGAV